MQNCKLISEMAVLRKNGDATMTEGFESLRERLGLGRIIANAIAVTVTHAAEGPLQPVLSAFCFRIARPAIRYVIT